MAMNFTKRKKYTPTVIALVALTGMIVAICTTNTCGLRKARKPGMTRRGSISGKLNWRMERPENGNGGCGKAP